MNTEQYKVLKHGFVLLKEAHKLKDWYMLNYGANIVEKFHNFKDFELVKEHILEEIGWRND